MQTSLPKISIVTVVYNGVNTIEQTILSVINQTYSNIEYIIIDGGSTDGTVDIIKKYQDKITYWVSEKDEGISDAFNKGVQKATGEWVIFMNGGDRFFDNNILAKGIPFLTQHSDKDVIYGKIQLEDKGIMKGVYGKSFSEFWFHIQMTIPHQASFFNKNVFDKAGLFDLSFKRAMDYEFLLRLKPLKIIFINQTIAFMAAGGISQSDVISVFKEFKNAKRIHLSKSSLRIALEYIFTFVTYFLAQILRIILKLGN